MSRSLRILERAQSDVDDIFSWLARRTVLGSVAWYVALHRAVAQVADAPDSFPDAVESHALGRSLRQSLFKTRRGRVYRIVFEVSDKEITVLRIRGPGQS